MSTVDYLLARIGVYIDQAREAYRDRNPKRAGALSSTADALDLAQSRLLDALAAVEAERDQWHDEHAAEHCTAIHCQRDHRGEAEDAEADRLDELHMDHQMMREATE